MNNFDKLKLKFKGNTIALGIFDLSSPATGDRRLTTGDIPVERDASGVPVAWRIFKLGVNEITREGETFSLDFTSEMFDQIIAYFAEKGAKIPLDSSHFLYYLAEKLQVSEDAIVKLIPDGQGTFGFGSLEKRTDGLWVTNVEYVPLARELMAQRIFRYFSPVIRGLVDGRLRVTSVAFINQPALNNLDAIAASAERGTGVSPVSILEIQGNLDALAASADITRNKNKQSVAAEELRRTKKEKEVNKLLIAIAGLLRMDSISLGADGDASADVVTKLENFKTEVTGLRDGKQKSEDFLKTVKEKLALGADADSNVVVGKIIAVAADAGQATQLKARVDALELSAETEKRDKLVEQGVSEGKLVGELLDWAKGQNSISLGAFLKVQRPVIDLGQVNLANLGNSDAVALTAEDKNVAKLLGLDEAKMLEAKKTK